MTRVAWFNCHAGVAGDMTMAALVDAGADRDDIGAAIAGLGVDGYALLFERVERSGVAATWSNVVIDGAPSAHDHRDHHHDEAHAHGHRPVRDVLDLLDAADLAPRVRSRARAVFLRLAEVEGAIHGHDPMDVELHEVGALDSIIDVVGACAALESLGVDEIRCSPVAVGHGTIRSAHGLLPNPAPATVALLTEAGAPTVGLDTTLEVTTPTGAALMTTLAGGYGALPAMTGAAVGYGAGTADPPGRANVVQVVVGTATTAPSDADPAPPSESVLLLECNVDDVTGEVLAHTITRLMEAGALDAWATPIVMKKGRPAHTVSVLAAPELAAELRAVLAEETGTLGVRGRQLDRWVAPRTASEVDVGGHPIGIKIAAGRIKVEFDDAATAARALGLPVRVVIDRATAAASARPFS